MDAKVEAIKHITPLLEACRALTLEPPQPCLVCDEGDEVVAFAPYSLTHMATWKPLPSMSEAVAAYFGQESGGYQAAKAPLAQAIKAGRERLARRRTKLVEEQASAGDPDALKQMGEAVLAYAHQIEPGASELIAEWVAGEPPLR